MLRMLRYLRDSKWTVLLIFALLILQAVCDLALPQYTSAIVDIGIQQGGIESAAPTQLRAQTMDVLQALMPEDERTAVQAQYTLDAAGEIYHRAEKLDAETLEVLDGAFSVPMALLGSVQESQGMDMDTIARMMQSGLVSEDQIETMRAQAMESIGDVNDSLLTQRAILFVRGEYEAMGMDMGRMQTDYLILTGLKMLGITVVMVAAAILVGLFASRTAAKVGRDLRGRMFSHVVSFAPGDMERFSTASLITRNTSDVQQVQMVIVMMLRMVLYAPILGIGGVLKVVGTNTGLEWIIAVAVAAVMILVAVLITIAMPKFRKMQTLVDRINLVAREILTGLGVVRAFSREEFENERFDKANTDLMRTQLFTNRVMTFMMPLMMMIMNIVTLSIVWFGAQGIDMGTMQVGNMMAFITYTMQIIMSFLMLTMISVFLPRAAVAASRIDEVLETTPSISDKPDAQQRVEGGFQGVIAFDHVSFRYPDASEDVLADISFTAAPGKTTAIIGATGSGKSTLLNLIPRFYDVTAGRVTLDGTDVRDLPQHLLREQLGYVPQKGVLFSGSIATNIKYGGEDITDVEMKKAAAIAQAEDFILEKPEQYEDPIAQGGTNVSGGQKQRLSIARAIAKQPKALLFDDSFSALDYRTDVTLRRALRTEIRDATVIIVAQRISTILHADQILVLEEGRVVGMGTHAELMAGCSTYQEIAKSQLSQAELEGGRGA